jgi:small subunit ribosomal protein S1
LVPFGAFVRVADGIEGLVHISELSDKHIELAEQVVSTTDQVFVKIIDIDLERRRISLSIKQANEGVDAEGTEFDPALYGMPTEYDDKGNYAYPEGFNVETGEWSEGFDDQRKVWEQQYADAQTRWQSHKVQVAHMAAMVIVPVEVVQGESDTAAASQAPEEQAGTLADDEALAALRDKLIGSSE